MVMGFIGDPTFEAGYNSYAPNSFQPPQEEPPPEDDPFAMQGPGVAPSPSVVAPAPAPAYEPPMAQTAAGEQWAAQEAPPVSDPYAQQMRDLDTTAGNLLAQLNAGEIDQDTLARNFDLARNVITGEVDRAQREAPVFDETMPQTGRQIEGPLGLRDPFNLREQGVASGAIRGDLGDTPLGKGLQAGAEFATRPIEPLDRFWDTAAEGARRSLNIPYGVPNQYTGVANAQTLPLGDIAAKGIDTFAPRTPLELGLLAVPGVSDVRGAAGFLRGADDAAKLPRLTGVAPRAALEAPDFGPRAIEPFQRGTPESVLERVFGWRAPEPGLGARDQALNALKAVMRAGTPAEETATPLMRARAEALQVVDQQANRVADVVGSTVQDAFRLSGGRVSTIPGAPTVADIAARLPEFETVLTPAQKAAMYSLREEMRPLLDALAEVGITPETRGDIIEGGFYLPRGRADIEGLDEPLGKSGSVARRAGVSAPETRHATFASQAEGIQAGYKYPRPSEAIAAAYRHLGQMAVDEVVGGGLKQVGREAGESTVRGFGPIREGFDRLRGYEFPNAVRDAVDKELRIGRGRSTLEATVVAANNLMRMLRSTGDLSGLGIQSLLGLNTKPGAYKDALVVSMKALADENASGAFVRQFDQEAIAKGLPTSRDWIAAGSRYSGVDTEFTGGGLGRIGQVVQAAPYIRQTNRAFGAMGDALRLGMNQSEYEVRRIARQPADLDSITSAMNRATGWSNGRFLGDAGSIVQFAPRFFMSQLETVAKAASDGGIEGDIARRQLLRTVGQGVLFTTLANEALGNRNFNYWSPTIDGRTNPNFMRVRVGDVDLSVFGPWDSLLKATMAAAKGDPGYIARTKASPIVAMGWDLITGETFLGDDPKDPEIFLRNLLPFGLQQAGKEPIDKTLIGLTGLKASSVTEGEKTGLARFDLLSDPAKLGEVFSPSMAQGLQGKAYNNLTPDERRAVNENLPKEDRARIEKRDQESDSVFAATKREAQAVRESYNASFDTLLQAWQSGKSNPSAITSTIKEQINERDTKANAKYDTPAYQKAVEGLNKGDAQLQAVLAAEKMWHSIRDTSKIEGQVDYGVVEKRRSDLLAALAKDDPLAAERLAYAIQNRSSGPEHKAVSLYREANAALAGYYEADDKQAYRRQHPEADALFVFLYGGDVKTRAAAELYLQLAPGRDVKVPR